MFELYMSTFITPYNYKIIKNLMYFIINYYKIFITKLNHFFIVRVVKLCI